MTLLEKYIPLSDRQFEILKRYDPHKMAVMIESLEKRLPLFISVVSAANSIMLAYGEDKIVDGHWYELEKSLTALGEK